MKSRPFYYLMVLLSVITVCFSCSTGKTGEEKLLSQLRDEVKADLTENLLPWWIRKTTDTVNGGYYGRVDSDDRIYPEAERGGVVNSRILWTFSAAWRVLKDSSYLEAARRARDYIASHFIDRLYGGAFRSVNNLGEPLDTRKQIYIQSFFVYALSEYARATGDTSAITEARGIYYCIERHAFDSVNNGYYEVFSREWERSRDRILGEKTEKEEKTMNTHLHLLESYSNLYRVWPDAKLRERLENLILIFEDKILDKERYHLISFLERDWTPSSNIDSYGHDIEASWLLCEAAGLLDDKELLNRVRSTSVRIAGAAAEGLFDDGSLATDKDLVTGHIAPRRSWWEQSEAVVGFLNAWEVSGDEEYLEKSISSWNYIRAHLVDARNGGWFSTVSEDGQPGRSDKAGFWICPYHNGRMCLEVIERSDHLIHQ